MPRKPASPSRLSQAQRRALLAVNAGKVVRKFQHHISALTSPGIGSKALWQLMRDHLIQDGSIDDDRCVMTLTLKGHQELALILREPSATETVSRLDHVRPRSCGLSQRLRRVRAVKLSR